MTIEEMLNNLIYSVEARYRDAGATVKANKRQIIQYVKDKDEAYDDLYLSTQKMGTKIKELEQKVEKYETVIRHAKMATDIDDDIKSVHPRVLKQINYSLTKALEEPR